MDDIVGADARVRLAVVAPTVADRAEGRLAGVSEPVMDSAAAAARSAARRVTDRSEGVVDVAPRIRGAESVSTPEAPFHRGTSVTGSSFRASCPVVSFESVVDARRRTAVDGRSTTGDGGVSDGRLIVRHNES